MSDGSNFPEGKRIAFTGRLASMSRAAVVNVVMKRGGLFRDVVTKQTDVLVVGADGWPLRTTGAVTRNLRRAGKLREAGYSVSIIGEAEFLRRLCDSDEVRSIRREHTLEQLSRLLGISGLRLRRWIEIGLIKPADTAALTPMFNYEQVAAARTLSRLVARGVPLAKLAASLRRLQQWLPDDSRLGVSIIAIENQLLVRDGDELIDSLGQLHFAFDRPVEESQHRTSSGSMGPIDPDELFDRAHRYECDNQFDEAIADYGRWLNEFGDDHEVLFNLANAYSQKGFVEQAIDYYRRCLQMKPSYACAWNNLGLRLHETGDRSEAIVALRNAVDLDPTNVSAMFNLADMLDEAGSSPEANLLWLRILRQRENSEDDIQQYARDRFAEIDHQIVPT